jgi:hypothetical protein
LFSTGNSTPTIEGKAYYLDASENWILADYNNSANKLVALARGTTSDVSGMWIGSNETDISLNVPGDIGSVLYLDLSGNLSTTKPLIANSLIRPVGYKLSSNYIKYILSFNSPSPVEASLFVSSGLFGFFTISYLDSLGNTVLSPQTTGSTVYTFADTGTSPGTTRSGSVIPNFSSLVEYLVIAGGGGGGNVRGGGGGAGGYRTAADLYIIIGSSYTVTVGAGGAGAPSGSGGAGINGSNSVFSSITSTGGGASLASGGSGGGANGSNGALGGAGNTPATTPSQGNNGGNGINFGAGGGGGAGDIGVSGTASVAGNGGNGLSSSITGTATFRGGGGGGGHQANLGGTRGLGGTGGGGNGGLDGSTIATSGTANTGGGGGGAGGDGVTFFPGGAGGSGIVIIRFPSFI